MNKSKVVCMLGIGASLMMSGTALAITINYLKNKGDNKKKKLLLEMLEDNGILREIVITETQLEQFILGNKVVAVLHEEVGCSIGDFIKFKGAIEDDSEKGYKLTGNECIVYIKNLQTHSDLANNCIATVELVDFFICNEK